MAVVVDAFIAAANKVAQLAASVAHEGDRVTPSTAIDPVEGTPVNTMLAVEGVAAPRAVPSPSWQLPHSGSSDIFPKTPVMEMPLAVAVAAELRVYVPVPPRPVPYAEMYVFAGIPDPVMYAPRPIVPLAIAVTVRVVLLAVLAVKDEFPYRPSSQYRSAIQYLFGPAGINNADRFERRANLRHSRYGARVV